MPAQITDVNLTAVFFTIIVVVLVLFILTLLGYFLFVLFKNRNREEKSLESVLLQVAVPRGNEIKIDVMEQLFASLFSIKKGGWKQKFGVQPTISFEIVGRQEDIRFYIWVPKKLQDLVEKQVHGAYPDAEVIEVDEYNLFAKEGKVAYKSLQLGKGNFYPLKTYKELATDPLASITSAVAKMGPDEGAAIQILVSPASSDWQKEGGKFISDTKKNESDPQKARFATSAKVLEAIEAKTGKPGFETSIRIVVVSKDKDMAKMHLDNISSTFEQFASENNHFKSRKIRAKGAFMDDYIYRYQPMFNVMGNHVSILNAEELATIFHFPNKQVTTPHVFWLYSKTAPAPALISEEGIFLGMSNYRGVKKKVFIAEDDRRRHVYIIGKTGVGKSELLKQMILQDINDGKGVCFIDPHDTVRQLLTMIPPERAEDVIYFYPGDVQRPMGINLLDAKTEDERHFAATAVINMMYKLFDPYKTGIVGPRFEHAIRNAMLTVMEAEPGATFIEVVQALERPDYVQYLLPKVTDPIIRRYWTDQIAQTSDFHKSEVLDYIVSKFGRFVTNKMIRNIIGQSQSSFDFRKVMDEGKILLVDLAKGEIGEENSNFLGLILVPRILMAAMSRQNIPEDQRRDFYLYVDEFQNFATPDFAQILSEARKYRLNLTVANQFIGQVEEEVKNAVFGNVGTMISFRVGVSDASYLAHEYSPIFGEDDLLNIERYHGYVKTIVHNEPVPPFSLDMTKDITAERAKENKKIAEIVREMSRLKFGKDERMVTAEIARRAKL
jgi:hypothetical protein